MADAASVRQQSPTDSDADAGSVGHDHVTLETLKLDALLQHLLSDPGGRLLWRVIVDEGLARAGLFALVAARLTGLLCVGPLLGRSLLSWPVRVGLIVLLTLVVAPTLPLEGEVTEAVRLVGHADDSFARPASLESGTLMILMISPVGLCALLLCELGLGAVMGLGVAVLLSGLKLAGEWLDRHSGLGMGGVLNPEFLSEGSASAELVLLFGTAALLLMEPVGGHLLLTRTILDSFHSFPVGRTVPDVSLVELLGALLRESLLLGLRVAMPLVVAMSLFDMTLGFACRSSRWSLIPVAYAARTSVALLVLAATWPGIAEAVSTTALEALRQANESLLARAR